MYKNPKLPNKGAVAKLRTIYNEITNTKITLEQKKEIEELIKKNQPSTDQNEESNKYKKIASLSEDADLI